MNAPAPAPAVRHNPAASRYETEVDGHLAVIEYLLAGGRLTLTHTFVPTELRGRGVAELLVRAALDAARVAGQRVVPQCSYVARFIERHPEYQPLLDA
jgi:hypothetical protein